MLVSMTGFGSKESEIKPCGKVRVELRSVNHKFMETLMHLPDGFLSLEEKIKKTIESKIKRGRIICLINITAASSTEIFVNKALLANYVATIRKIKKQFDIADDLSINTLMRLPGVVSLADGQLARPQIWSGLKDLLEQALEELVATRRKEGVALHRHLRSCVRALDRDTGIIKNRFSSATKQKLLSLQTNEERSSYLKETDITEELERITFHIRNFKNKISKSVPMGKELDFIAQEMQREANTLAAKAQDKAISVHVVQIKSQIEKIREQLQNVE